MSKESLDNLYQMLLKGLKVLFAWFNQLGVVNIDTDKFFAEMDKPDEEAE